MPNFVPLVWCAPPPLTPPRRRLASRALHSRRPPCSVRRLALLALLVLQLVLCPSHPSSGASTGLLLPRPRPAAHRRAAVAPQAAHRRRGGRPEGAASRSWRTRTSSRCRCCSGSPARSNGASTRRAARRGFRSSSSSYSTSCRATRGAGRSAPRRRRRTAAAHDLRERLLAIVVLAPTLIAGALALTWFCKSRKGGGGGLPSLRRARGGGKGAQANGLETGWKPVTGARRLDVLLQQEDEGDAVGPAVRRWRRRAARRAAARRPAARRRRRAAARRPAARVRRAASADGRAAAAAAARRRCRPAGRRSSRPTAPSTSSTSTPAPRAGTAPAPVERTE